MHEDDDDDDDDDDDEDDDDDDDDEKNEYDDVEYENNDDETMLRHINRIPRASPSQRCSLECFRGCEGCPVHTSSMP